MNNMVNQKMLHKHKTMLVKKALDLTFVWCNQGFLACVGLSAEQNVAGLTDYDLPWSEYAELYHKHEHDTLQGNEYAAIVPIKDYKGKEFVVLNTRTQRKDKNGNIIGTTTYATEIINPDFLELTYVLTKKSPSSTRSFFIGHRTLARREQECIFYLLRGHTAKKIGALLHLSPKTVEHYIENIKLKFGCYTKADLIGKAIQEGYMDMIPQNINSKQLICTLEN